MQIEYKSNKLAKICTMASVARKEYGVNMAVSIQQRVEEIMAADCVEDMVTYHIGRCHPLKGDRKNQYAVDLIQPHRLVFTVKGEAVQIARIIEIVKDYHS